jgi:hypothetical protein
MQNHVMCRCVQAPAVRGSRLNIQKGSDWFAQQPAEVQKEILDKPGQYEAYRSGKLRLEDFVGLKRSAQWGDRYRVLSLKEALAREGRFPTQSTNPPIIPSLPASSTLLAYATSPPQNIRVQVTNIGRRAIREVFGRDLSNQEIAWAVGALDGSELNVTDIQGDIYVRITHPWIRNQERTIKKDRDGIQIQNNYFIKVGDAPSQVGIRSFAREVFGARALGITRIKTYAAGDRMSSYNGYYTWARFGYNAPLYPREIAILPEELEGSVDLNDIFNRGGAEWWKDNGSSREMEFDLRDRSQSMLRLLEYIRNKERR